MWAFWIFDHHCSNAGQRVGLSEKRCEYVRVRLAPPSMATHIFGKPYLLLCFRTMVIEDPERPHKRSSYEKGTDSRYGQKSGHRPEQPAALVPTGRFEVLQAGHHGQAHHHGPQNLGLYRPAIARTNERGGIKERRLAGTRGHRCCAITGSGTGQSGSPG